MTNVFRLTGIFLVSFFLFSINSCSDSDSSDNDIPAGNPNGLVKNKPDSVGDIVLSDGTAIGYMNGLILSESQRQSAIAVIFYTGNESDSLGKKMLGVGLKHEKVGVKWCWTAAHAYSKKIPSIASDSRLVDSELKFFGDIEGSDNLEQIGYVLSSDKDIIGDDSNDTYPVSRYPAFGFAFNYKDNFSRIKNTAYESGWYLPTVAELYQAWKNREVVDAASKLAGGDEFSVDNYWTSSISSDGEVNCASRILFLYGTVDSTCRKDKERPVCAIREF